MVSGNQMGRAPKHSTKKKDSKLVALVGMLPECFDDGEGQFGDHGFFSVNRRSTYCRSSNRWMRGDIGWLKEKQHKS
jgi:hypothetical protein